MKALSIFIFVFFLAALCANYVENQPFEHIQPDGSSHTLYVTGDEYDRRVHDEQGYTILIDPATGYAVYAEPEGSSARPSPYVVGSVDPVSLGLAPNLIRENPDGLRVRKEQQAYRDAGNRGSPVGTLVNIVGFVRFADQTEFPSTPTYSTYNNQFNSTTQQSLKDYYNEVSSGQLTINSNLYPAANIYGRVVSLQVSHNRGYYLPYSASNTIGYSTTDQKWDRLWNLTVELIGLIDPHVPNGLDLDNDNDGIMDALTFIFRGEVDAWGGLIWPTHWGWGSSLGTLNGSSITHYVFDFEGSSPPLGVSVICHEMGHMIGFPDLYHYTSNGITPVGQWSLMASDNAQHELAWEKYKYGTWFASLPTITPTSTPTTYTLNAIDTSPYACYKINSSLTNQYYMVEYRRTSGRYDVGIPGSGLIVYRIIDVFGTTDIRGNADGPPDEIYIYRIGGTINVNGTTNSANMSSTVNRTKIHTGANPEPWLYSNTGTQLDGNLVITDVGASGGTSISFIVRDSPPNIWTGASSTAWNTAGNWSLGHVPTATEDVELPGLIARYPIVSTAQSCRSVLIKSGASLTIAAGTLTITNDLTCFGTLAMNNAASVLYVQRDLFFENGGTASITASANIYVMSDIEFRAGSNVNMTNGTIRFYGTGTSYFRIYAPATIYHFVSDKDSPYVSGNSALSTSTLTISGNFYVYAGSTFSHPYAGTTVVKGGFYVYTTAVFNATNGTVSLEGTTSTSLYMQEPASSFYNLTINKTGTSTVLCYFPVNVTRNLSISSGVLNSDSKTISVKGSWTNSVGASGFVEGTGTVVLNGTGTQTISTETFNILQLNKSGGFMSIPSGSVVTAASYDWVAGEYRVSGGTFTVADLVDPGIFGTIVLSSGTINYTQDTGQFIDLRANLTISGGVFNVSGGSSVCWFSYVDVATLTMSSGTLDIKSQSIRITSGYAFNDNITGGTIRTVGSFLVERADFNPLGGTIELYGGNDCNLQNTAGSNMFRIYINKSVSREDGDIQPMYADRDRDVRPEPPTRTNAVTGVGPLDINGNFVINAGTFTAPASINLAGGWYNYVGQAAFNEGTGTVTFDGSDHQYCNYTENFYAIVINKSGGALRVNSSPAVVTCASYSFVAGAVDVLLGTFTANDLVQNGIYGNFYNNAGGTINLYQDAAQFIDLNGYIYNYGGTYNIYGGSMSCYPAYDANGGISMSSGTIDFKTRGITIMNRPYTLTWNITGGTIRTVSWFSDSRGGIVFSGGELEFYGPNQSSLTLGAGSSLYNLKINKSSTRGERAIGLVAFPTDRLPEETNDFRVNDILLGSNVTITNDLTLTAGSLNVTASNYNIAISGNWVNNVGTSAFIAGTGTVTFNKVGDTQDISGATNFYNLVDSHTGLALRFLGNTGIAGTLTVGHIITFHDSGTMNIVDNSLAGGVMAFYNNETYTIASYTGGGDLRCWSGCTVIIGDLTQNGLYGNYIASNGSHLEVHQDTSNWIDINGNMTIETNAIVDIYGGSMACYPGYNGNCLFTMSSGEFNVKNNGIYFYNNGFTCDMQVSGGTIRANGSWTDVWGVFDPTGGTVEFTGSADVTIATHASSWFWTLKVNKVVSRDEGEPQFTLDREGNSTPVTRSCVLWIQAATLKGGLTIQNANTVYLNGAMNSTNTGLISIANGLFNLNGYNLTSTGNVIVSSGGQLRLTAGSNLFMSNGRSIAVGSGGYLLLFGSSSTAATITRNVSGTYGLAVNSGGTIGGNYGIFEYMNTAGVTLNPGSLVHTTYSLNYCTFRMGASGGKLLTINNNQSFTVTGAVFPTNTWGGAYNVSKTLDDGIVYFAGWSGAFGGPSFEQDTYNHIYWEGFGIPPVTDLTMTHVAGTSNVRLDWTYPLTASYYKVYRSTNPYGTFTYWTNTGNNYLVTSSTTRYFYKVTAVVP